jgi:hypothetical protein
MSFFFKRLPASMKTIVYSAAPALVGLALSFLSQINPELTEKVYARNIYPKIAAITGILGGFERISSASLIIASVFILAALWLFLSLANLVLRKWSNLKILVLLLIASISSVYLLFAIICAPNYNRLSIIELMEYEHVQATTDDLFRLCNSLADTANQLASVQQRNCAGTIEKIDFLQTAMLAKDCFNDLASRLEFINDISLPPKPVLFSNTLSVLKLTGFYFPYTNEANVNTEMPTLEIPFTMLHELSHACGIMREDEANFLAFIAGRDNTTQIISYSCNINALNYCMDALYYDDFQLYQQIRSKYSVLLNNDLNGIYEYWSFYDSPAATMSDRINDIYLKANNQQSGVKSYGQMVELMLHDFIANEHDMRAGL